MGSKEVVYPQERQDEFQAFLAEIAYHLRTFARDQRDRDVCNDVIKGKRLSPNGLRILCELAAISDRPGALPAGLERTVASYQAMAPSPLPYKRRT